MLKGHVEPRGVLAERLGITLEHPVARSSGCRIELRHEAATGCLARLVAHPHIDCIPPLILFVHVAGRTLAVHTALQIAVELIAELLSRGAWLTDAHLVGERGGEGGVLGGGGALVLERLERAEDGTSLSACAARLAAGGPWGTSPRDGSWVDQDLWGGGWWVVGGG